MSGFVQAMELKSSRIDQNRRPVAMLEGDRQARPERPPERVRGGRPDVPDLG